jgi:hypothetical protein
MSQKFVSDQSFCAGLISEPPDLEMSAPLSESSDAEPGYDKPRKKRRLNPELWDYSRSPKGSEQMRDKHYHEIYYCKLCEAYRGSPNAQRFREHLARKHHVYVGKTSDSRQKTALQVRSKPSLPNKPKSWKEEILSRRGSFKVPFNRVSSRRLA